MLALNSICQSRKKYIDKCWSHLLRRVLVVQLRFSRTGPYQGSISRVFTSRVRWPPEWMFNVKHSATSSLKVPAPMFYVFWFHLGLLLKPYSHPRRQDHRKGESPKRTVRFCFPAKIAVEGPLPWGPSSSSSARAVLRRSTAVLV